jgi:uncharacterized membrane protein YqgA involved in biofilm formation
VTGTFINIATVLLGTTIGVTVGSRLSESVQQRVLYGLGLVTLVIGASLALSWSGPGTTRQTPLYVLGGILLGGLAGEAIGIEQRLEQLGGWVQGRLSQAEHSTIAEGFVDASLLFCVGSLAVVGSIQDGLTGNYETLATKAVLDGFASIALAATLGWGVGLSVFTILVYQGGLTLGASVFSGVLRGEALAALTSAGGVTIIGISLKLLAIRDVKVANYLPALVIAPALVGLASLVT